jgi:hypothetical protein
MLLKRGMRSQMYVVNERYKKDYPGMVGIEKWPPRDLARGDIVVAPEFYWSQPDTSRSLLNLCAARGARLVVYFLGLHRPMTDYTRTLGGATFVPLSHRMNEHLQLPTLAPLSRPLQLGLYRQGREFRRSGRAKDDVILVDGDTELSGAVREHFAAKGYAIIVVDKLPQSEVVDLYRRARVYVDLDIPGLERGFLEASLFEVAPVVTSAPAGCDLDLDARVHPDLRVEPSSVGAVIAAIERALVGRTRRMAAAMLRRSVESWLDGWETVVDYYFTSAATAFVFFAGNGDNEWTADDVVASVATMVMLFPLSRVYVVVDSAALGASISDRLTTLRSMQSAALIVPSLSDVVPGDVTVGMPSRATLLSPSAVDDFYRAVSSQMKNRSIDTCMTTSFSTSSCGSVLTMTTGKTCSAGALAYTTPHAPARGCLCSRPTVIARRLCHCAVPAHIWQGAVDVPGQESACAGTLAARQKLDAAAKMQSAAWRSKYIDRASMDGL